MTEHTWLKFAGLMNECIFQLEHKHCPFSKYRSMDQHQRAEALLTITDEHANAIMKKCLLNQTDCEPVLIQRQESSWDLSAIR